MYRAIVVDDEPFMLEGMRLMIRWADCGFQLIGEAATAQDALRLAEETRPDLVITDIRMPGLLGTELAEELSRRHPDTMLIFFSGYRDFSYAQAAIRTHVFDYLLKPIDPDEVHKTLRRACEELDKRRAGQRKPLKMPREHVLRRLAYGDDSAETLRQCGEALSIAEDETICCAVLEADAALLADAPSGASDMTMFALTGTLTGLMHRGAAGAEAFARYANAALNRRAPTALGVGMPGVGAVGFRQSVRQAMEALGPWCRIERGARLYRPYEKELAVWLYDTEQIALVEALKRRDAARVTRIATKLETLCRERMPDAQYLRVMAKDIETSLPGDEHVAALRRLWKDETLEGEAWLGAFAACLRGLVGRENDAREPASVRRALQCIEDEYARDLTVGDVAARLYVNAAYLGHLIRKHTGATFHQHLLRARVRHACRLLRQTAMPIGEVALSVGFSDVDYFSAQFRGQMGVPPLVYRNAVESEAARP